MLNQNDISPNHLPPMQAALMKHRSKLDEARVSGLYKQARAILAAKEVTLANSIQMVVRRDLQGQPVAVTCTDVETGIFVQLQIHSGQILLTFGQKFCEESHNAATSSLVTKIWT